MITTEVTAAASVPSSSTRTKLFLLYLVDPPLPGLEEAREVGGSGLECDPHPHCGECIIEGALPF